MFGLHPDSLTRPAGTASPRLARLRRWSVRPVPAVPDLLPGILCLVLFAGIFWAVTEHARHKAELKGAETERYLTEFAEAPVADAWHRLGGGGPRASPAPDTRFAQLVDPSPDRRLSDAVSRRPRALPDTAYRDRRAADLDVVVRFFRRLARCIRMDSCDQAQAAAELGDLAWRFRDRHRALLEAEYPGEDLDRDFATIAPRPED